MKNGKVKIIGILLVILSLALMFTACADEHEHSYGERKETKAPTCTEAGEEMLFCECGEQKSEETAALGHSFKEGVCERCGEEDEEKKPCWHENTEIIPAAPATCAEAGLTEGKKCKDCGTVLISQTATEKADHKEETVKGYDATCSEEGLTDGVKCSVCKEWIVEQKVINTNDHTEETIKGYDATCSEEGLTDGVKCTVCKEWIVEQSVIHKVAHTYGDIYDAECNVCGFVRDAACKHENLITILGKNATCTVPGITDGKVCAKCEEVIEEQNEIAAKGHSKESIDGYPPTCTAKGLTDGVKCSRCLKILVPQKVLAEIPHKEEIIPGFDATCIDEGLTAGVKCSVCETWIVAQEVVSKSAHTYDDIYDANCNICDFVRDAACKHENIIAIPGKDATCTEAGLSEGKVCADCEEAIVAQEEISAKGHTVENIKGSDATCTKKGLSDGVKCLVCEIWIVLQEEIEAKGHTEETVKGYDATCTKEGLSDGVMCSVCLTVIKEQDVVPAKGHCFVNGVCEGCGLAWSKGLEFVSNGNGTCYVSKIGTCTDNNIVIPEVSPEGDSVTGIGDYAFHSCTSLRSIVIGDSVTSIGDSAFTSCNSLRSIVIPDSVESIGDKAFSDCMSLTNVMIGGSVTSIGDKAFYYCTALTNIEVSPCNTNYESIYGHLYTKGGATLIQYAIGNKKTSFTIPDSVTSIGDFAFRSCKSLISVEMSDSVASIGNEAFSWCTSLTNVVIPDSVTNIGDHAFVSCSSLTSIAVSSGNTNYESIDGNLYTKGGKTLVQYAIGKTETSFTIPDSVTSIGDEAFSWCTSLTNVVIGDSVTSIGYSAFYYCYSLESVVIGDSVTSIGDSAFNRCTSLVSVVIPDGVTSIRFQAFRECDSLTSIVIGDSVTSIGVQAFDGCTSLTSIEVSQGNSKYKSIDGNLYTKDGKTLVLYAMGKAETTVVVADIVEGIGDSAFYAYKLLKSLVIGDSVTRIGKFTFRDCTSLTSVVIPNSVTNIGDDAFSWCNALRDVYYTGSKEEWKQISIGSSGNSCLIDATRYYYSENEPTKKGNFWHYVDGEVVVWPACVAPVYSEGLEFASNGNGTCYVSGIGTCTDTDIVIPEVSPVGDRVTSIGNYVFGGCTALESVVFPDSVESIGYRAFWCCTSLTSVVIPDGVTSIGGDAFYSCNSLTSVVIPDSVTSIGESAFYWCNALCDVYYTGSEEEWKLISIGYNNFYPINATIHYNYVPEK